MRKTAFRPGGRGFIGGGVSTRRSDPLRESRQSREAQMAPIRESIGPDPGQIHDHRTICRPSPQLVSGFRSGW